MAINIEKLSTTIMEKIGGIQNVETVTHCVTRIRFILKDVSKADTAALETTENILGVVYGSGQYQVILGPNLFPVFDYIVTHYKLETEDVVNEHHTEDVPAGKKGASYWLGKVTQFLSASLTPFITVLYGAGMLKVVLSLVTFFVPEAASNSTYTMFNFMASTPFYFMPIFIAYGSAKTLKANPAFAISMAAMLLYPDFVALVGGDKAMTMFGIPVILVKYSNTLLPAILSSLLLAKLEKFFYQVIPSVLRSVFAPLCTLAVALPIVTVVLAPLGTIVGNYIVGLFVWIYQMTGGIAIGLLAAVWPFIVMGGMNMLFVAPMTELLAKVGYDNFFRPTWILHNMAEGGACIGVALKTKNKQLKSDALSAAVGAIVSGVSEPAIYGINLRLKKPLYAVVIGGFAGGCTAGLMGARAYSLGYSSILAIPIFMDTMLAIVVAIAVTLVVSIAATYIMGFKDVAAIPENQ
jgi:PTS system beta-glucosides-specific IIC component